MICINFKPVQASFNFAFERCLHVGVAVAIKGNFLHREKRKTPEGVIVDIMVPNACHAKRGPADKTGSM